MIRLIESAADLAALAADLRRAGRFGFDLETNGLHAYRPRVCLLQFATPEGVTVLDPLAGAAPRAGTPLAEVLADPAVEKVVHGASHDVASLKEDFGVPLRGVFDTYVAATLLGRPKVGLADLVAEAHGVVLEKDLQKGDWGIRPLTPEMLAYLEKDVAYLLDLGDRIRADLEAAGIVEEAEIEFRRVEETPPTGTAFDPLGYFEIGGAKDLDDRGLAVLREVYLLRDRIARELDRPPFKVIAEGALLALAQRGARGRSTRRSLEGFRALRARHLRPLLDRFAEAIERGAAAGRVPDEEREAASRPRRPVGEGPRPTRAEREARNRRVEALRAWRKEEAARRGLPPMTVLPNAVIEEIARRNPRDVASLADVPGLGASRLARYGESIASLLGRLDEARTRSGTTGAR